MAASVTCSALEQDPMKMSEMLEVLEDSTSTSNSNPANRSVTCAIIASQLFDYDQKKEKKRRRGKKKKNVSDEAEEKVTISPIVQAPIEHTPSPKPTEHTIRLQVADETKQKKRKNKKLRNVPQEEPEPTPPEHTLTLDGKKSHTAAVDVTMVGRLIGKGGKQIRALGHASDTHIKVREDWDENGKVPVEITGSTDKSVEKAKNMLEEIAKNSVTVYIHPSKVGLIIGKGGSTIKDLQRKSGCRINIDSERKGSKQLRPVELKGSSASIEDAKTLMREIVTVYCF